MEAGAIVRTKTYTYVICALFAALTAVGAFIKIPMPLVPFTLQFLFVALSGVLLGSKRGLISQMLYVGIGLAGIPIFTKGGGIGYIFQPTFGYLIGFIFAAFIVGIIVETKLISFISAFTGAYLGRLIGIFVACFLSLIVVYCVGVAYMYFIVNLYIGNPLTWQQAIFAGAISCLPGDLMVCFITAVVGAQLIPILKKQQLI